VVCVMKNSPSANKESKKYSHRVFILGAGFSHHLSCKEFPLGNELSEIIRRLEIPELERHYQECNHEQPHLEEILTKLELDRYIHQKRKDEIKKLIFLKVQERLTVKSLGKINLDSSRELVKNLFSDNDVIITTNYDLLLDHLLDAAGLWSPLGNGYGNTIEADNFKSEEINQKLKNIRLLKIHGSFNFFLEPLVSGGMSKLISVLVNGQHPDYLDRDDLFQSAKNTHLNVDKNAKNLRAIVLPTYIKPFAQNRTTMKMWHEAGEAMENASVVNIIGYSFPEPDQMMSFLMSCPDANEFFKKDNRKLKINILNTKNEIDRIKDHIKRCLRANPHEHIDWREFVLDSNNPNQAYENLVKSLKGQFNDS